LDITRFTAGTVVIVKYYFYFILIIIWILIVREGDTTHHLSVGRSLTFVGGAHEEREVDEKKTAVDLSVM
jgi:hypothetical protein